jgi:ferredoxin
VHIRGGLGDFQVFTRVDERLVPLSRAFDGLPDRFDLVLDLRPPGAEGRIPPPGYYAPDGDPDKLNAILEEMPQMVGTFSKPRFVRLDAPACAGPEGCGRCLEACPPSALEIIEGAVAIDHSACPGCGLCTVVCPTGALQYRHPLPQELLAVVHARLADTRLSSGAAPTVIFRQMSVAESAPESAAAQPDDPVLTVPLESIGGVGPEVWLSTLAFGARQVVIALPQSCPARLQQVLAGEHAWAEALLTRLGFDRRRLHLRPAGAPEERLPEAEAAAIPAADFMPFQSKRNLIRHSAAHLAACGQVSEAALLPEGAPFGAVEVDGTACTLCMACGGVCPTGALVAAGDTPALKFVESACIQCGRCRETCPEQALGLVPRLGWDTDRVEKPQTLWAEAPAACLRCGRPFAPPGLLAKIQSRLADHWLYQREEDRRRLFMCRDCRVRDIFSPNAKETP